MHKPRNRTASDLRQATPRECGLRDGWPGCIWSTVLLWTWPRGLCETSEQNGWLGPVHECTRDRFPSGPVSFLSTTAHMGSMVSLSVSVRVCVLPLGCGMGFTPRASSFNPTAWVHQHMEHMRNVQSPDHSWDSGHSSKLLVCHRGTGALLAAREADYHTPSPHIMKSSSSNNRQQASNMSQLCFGCGFGSGSGPGLKL